MLFFTSNLSLAAFSQPTKVAMAAFGVEGSEPCQWHAVSQVCHICGTCPEVVRQHVGPVQDIAAECCSSLNGGCTEDSKRWRGVLLNSECLEAADGDGRALATVFGQKRVREGGISGAWPKGGEWENSRGIKRVSRSDRLISFFYPVWAPVKRFWFTVLTVLLLLLGFPTGERNNRTLVVNHEFPSLVFLKFSFYLKEIFFKKKKTLRNLFKSHCTIF